MKHSDPSPEELAMAASIASAEKLPAVRDDSSLKALALAVRALADERASVAVLRAAHDALYADLPHRNGGRLEALAARLLGLGHVPGPYDYGGEWWLWWPKKGRGACGRCGRDRTLIRYSNRWGKQYRYLCSACRAVERADDAAMAEEAMAQLSLLLAARQEGDQRVSGSDEKGSEDLWEEYVGRLVELLSPLEWAGWEVPESFDCDGEPGSAPILFGELQRGRSVLIVEYAAEENKLEFQPYENVCGDHPEPITAVEECVEIDMSADAEAARLQIAGVAGELGLLDALHVRLVEDAPPAVVEDFRRDRLLALLEPAARHRGISLGQLAGELAEDDELSAYINFTVGLAGRDVEPDVVPDAAALGIAAWCWRNNTDVEAHHLSSDVLMARVNMAVTRAVRPHVCPVEGIDWQGVEDALADPDWALPNGRKVSDLFNSGWPAVVRSVRARVRHWRKVDEDLLGPEAVLRLLTVGGSTSYTRHWWGQGRWPSICERVVRDAEAAGARLPQPYDSRGSRALIDSLSEAPDLESDAVLGWFIDMEGALDERHGASERPSGLRFHSVTRPLIRTYEPWWEAE